MGMYCEIRSAPFNATGRQGSRMVNLEKAWHGIHFLLTASAMEGSWPFGFLLYGGEAVGADEATRRLSPASVREVNTALSSISDTELWGRFDADRMTAEGVYPNIWDEPEEELKEEYLMYYRELKQFIEQAAQAG